MDSDKAGGPFAGSGRAAACVLVLALLAARSLADEVVLTNGSTLEGEIVEETELHVVIQCGPGRMTFTRDWVRSVTRSKAPATTEGRRPVARARGPIVRNSTGRARRTTNSGIAELYRQIERIRLERWPEEAPEPVREVGAQSHKIVAMGGATRYANSGPAVQMPSSKVYARRLARGADRKAAGRDGMVWKRLHWNPDRRAYVPRHRAEEAFVAHQELFDRIRDRVARELNWRGETRARSLVLDIVRKRTADPRAVVTIELAELRRAAEQVPGLTDTLFNLHRLTIEMALAGVGKRVRLAQERRDLLEKAVKFVTQR